MAERSGEARRPIGGAATALGRRFADGPDAGTRPRPSTCAQFDGAGRFRSERCPARWDDHSVRPLKGLASPVRTVIETQPRIVVVRIADSTMLEAWVFGAITGNFPIWQEAKVWLRATSDHRTEISGNYDKDDRASCALDGPEAKRCGLPDGSAQVVDQDHRGDAGSGGRVIGSRSMTQQPTAASRPSSVHADKNPGGRRYNILQGRPRLVVADNGPDPRSGRDSWGETAGDKVRGRFSGSPLSAGRRQYGTLGSGAPLASPMEGRASSDIGPPRIRQILPRQRVSGQRLGRLYCGPRLARIPVGELKLPQFGRGLGDVTARPGYRLGHMGVGAE